MAKIKSIEEKAKRYDEALKVLHKYDDANIMFSQDLKEEMFPELKESEDEQHRKWILEYLYDSLRKSDEQFKDQFKCAIAWFEKQGEQKPVDKVEPKFHEGDWIVRELDNTCYQIKKCILNVTNNKYGYDLTSGGYISSQDANFYHLWTLQDAKDGDVLATDDWVFIFKELNAYGKPVCYCHYDDELGFKVDVNSYMATGSEIHSATKEQRDLLFQKMKEAGYIWDTEKKELRKIEQKPVEWSREDESMRIRCIGILSKCYMNERPDKVEEELNWLKSLRPHSTWKPSDEQINALAKNIEYVSVGCTKPILKGLLEDLKKLWEK